MSQVQLATDNRSGILAHTTNRALNIMLAELYAGIGGNGGGYTPTTMAQNGSTDDSAALSSAIASALGVQSTIIISGPVLLGSNVTVPANVQLTFVGKGLLRPASGITATINGALYAGAWRIFDTSLGGVITGAVRNSEIPVEWFGAMADGATASGAFINNALALALASGVSVRLLGGTYKTQDATLSLGGVSFTRPCILGTSKKQTILDYSAAGANFIGIKVRGGSGQVTGDSVKDLTLVGHSTSIGIEYNGACGANSDNVLFGANAVGIQCHNETASSFTEFCTATRCEQSTACAKFWTYKVTAGNNSFHGSGPGGGLDNLVQCSAAQTIVVHALGTGTFVYHAPCNLQVFCTASNVTIFQNDNSVAPIPLSYYGHVDIETNSGRTTTLGGGSPVLFVGPVRTIGAANITGANILAGTFMRIEAYQGHADGSVSFAGGKYNQLVTLASGATLLSSPLNSANRMMYLNIQGTNYLRKYLYNLDHTNTGAAITLNPIGTNPIYSFDSASVGAPTLTMDTSGRLTITSPTFARTATAAFTGGETQVSISPSLGTIPLGTYNVLFSNGDIRAVTWDTTGHGSWTTGLTSAATTTITLSTYNTTGGFTAYVSEQQISNGLQGSGHLLF